jgi:hypothetical protein
MNISELKMQIESIKELILEEKKGNKTNKTANIVVYQNRLEDLNYELAHTKPEVPYKKKDDVINSETTGETAAVEIIP